MTRSAIADALRPAGIWVDPHGVTHVRRSGTDCTRCGKPIGHYTARKPKRACTGCANAPDQPDVTDRTPAQGRSRIVEVSSGCSR